jgi:hypothetical protein
MQVEEEEEGGEGVERVPPLTFTTDLKPGPVFGRPTC